MAVKFFDLGEKPSRLEAKPMNPSAPKKYYPSFYIRRIGTIPFLEEAEVGEDVYVIAKIHKVSHEEREAKREGQSTVDECNMDFEIREVGTVKSKDSSESFLETLGMKAKE